MVHWKVKVVSAFRALVSPLPESVPELDHGPPAVQLTASAGEPQVSVARPPGVTEVGEAERVAVGVAQLPAPPWGAESVAVPAAPLPPPPEKLTVGADEYPEPGEVTEAEVTEYWVTYTSWAPEP